MTPIPAHHDRAPKMRLGALVSLAAGLALATACASGSTPGSAATPGRDGPTPLEELLARNAGAEFSRPRGLHARPPVPDPRVGLAPGMFDAGEAIWNLRMLSTTPPPEEFVGSPNTDLAFTGRYVVQGNFNGILVWDISDPADPGSVVTYVCPASQSDVSVYGDLLFVSGEDLGARLDCGTQGIQERVSRERLRGIRIFDISDIANPEYVGNVQTCRGSHTHSVLRHAGDDENVYVYVSGSSLVRPAEELPGCSSLAPEEDPNTALFRIEVIRVPLADPASAAIVSSPRIFDDLVGPPTHGPAPGDLAAAEEARARAEEARESGGFVAQIHGEVVLLPDEAVDMLLGRVIAERGGDGPPTAADSATLHAHLDSIVGVVMAEMGMGDDPGDGPAPGPNQCHDITVYPAIGMAGGACEGYGLLLDIRDPVNPRRIAEVADSNFSYWHSATFNNDGTAIIFTDEWGGGGGPKCRVDDPMEWGANAVFTIEDGELVFRSYYKLPAPQTSLENCVAHNGSLVPVPGRDIMIQGWYQGGISLIDWTDPENPVEIGYHDRGPFDADRMRMAGSWSVYWYNGVIVNSEIARGLDIFELTPSEVLSRNEIDAANSVRLTHLNAQGQPAYEWPPTFALARAYLDQLERWHGMSAAWIAAARSALDSAEGGPERVRRGTLRSLAEGLAASAAEAADAGKVAKLADAVQRLADAG